MPRVDTVNFNNLRYTFHTMAEIIKTAQDIQDDIFRKMSADKRLEVWVGLWRLAKDLTGDKIIYGTNGSQNASGKHRADF